MCLFVCCICFVFIANGFFFLTICLWANWGQGRSWIITYFTTCYFFLTWPTKMFIYIKRPWRRLLDGNLPQSFTSSTHPTLLNCGPIISFSLIFFFSATYTAAPSPCNSSWWFIFYQTWFLPPARANGFPQYFWWLYLEMFLISPSFFPPRKKIVIPFSSP